MTFLDNNVSDDGDVKLEPYDIFRYVKHPYFRPSNEQKLSLTL